MPRPLFILALALWVMAGVAYPLYQALGAGGPVYYTNGNDEAIYLQYDYALAAASALRPGQWLVVLGHRLGLAGGVQNLLADLVTPVAFALGLAWIFRRLGHPPAEARLAALGLGLIPLLFSATNPKLQALTLKNQYASTLGWFNMVDQANPWLLRTPEPQASWLIVVAALALALRSRTPWVLLAALPWCYPFVSIPVAFVALTWLLERAWRARGWPAAPVAALTGAALALAGALAVYFNLLVEPRVRVLLIPGHAPMLSLSSLIALAAYGVLRRGIPERYRLVALAAALAPLVACNQQVLSGTMGQPDNFEQFAGIVAIALVLVLGTLHRPWIPRVLVGLALLLSFRAGKHLYLDNVAMNGPQPPDPRLVEALREDPRHVAVPDVNLSSVLTLIHPRGGTTALAYDQSFPVVSRRYAPEYRCIRRRILAERADDPGFVACVRWLDHAYLYGSQDYAMANLGRKQAFVPIEDVAHGPCDPALDRPLRYFGVGAPGR